MIIATTRNKYLRLPMLPYSLLELYKRNLDDLTSHWLLLLLTLQRAHLFLAFLSHFTFQQTPIPNYSALHYSKIPSNSLYNVLHQPTIDVQHHVKKVDRKFDSSWLFQENTRPTPSSLWKKLHCMVYRIYPKEYNVQTRAVTIKLLTKLNDRSTKMSFQSRAMITVMKNYLLL